MKNLTAFTIAFTLICLHSEAQTAYQLLLKNQKNPYDSAVVIEISTYRQVRAKVTIADNYVNSLKKQIDSLKQETVISDELLSKYSNLQQIQDSSAKRNDIAFQRLNENFDKLLAKANEPKPKWFKRPWVFVAAGVFGGFLLRR